MKTLKWHGGKDRLVKKLNEIAPPPPHTKYLESHAGGLSYLFAKSPEGVSEFANDLNTHLTNFWNVIRTPYLFESFRGSVPSNHPYHQVKARMVLLHGGRYDC